MNDSEFKPFDETTKHRLRRLVATAVTPHLTTYSPMERAELLDGLSLLLTGEESHQARYAAHALRQAEEAQLTFLTML